MNSTNQDPVPIGAFNRWLRARLAPPLETAGPAKPQGVGVARRTLAICGMAPSTVFKTIYDRLERNKRKL